MSFQILACGSNGLYQLGLGNDQDHDSLHLVPGLEKFSLLKPKQLVFGGNHTFVLYPEGQLLGAGSNEHGQCGIESPTVLERFTRIPGRWKSVAAGWDFSVLCSYDDELFSCGSGHKGELGLGEQITLAKAPTKIEFPGNSGICDLQCSIGHTIVMLDNGSFIGWGAARKGQLGPQPPVVTAAGKEKPRPVVWQPKILDFGSSEKFCVGRDRTILVGSTIRVFGVEALEIDVRAHTVKAMWSSLHYTSSGGSSASASVFESDQQSAGEASTTNANTHGITITSVGNNLHGQCYKYNAPHPIRAFEVGSEHGLALLNDNSVYAWGWGEHGNCGAMRNGNVKFDYLNKIYDGKNEVVMMAGGLATTWIVVKQP